MQTPAQLVESMSDQELRQATRDALAWRSKGQLEGDALHKLAGRLEREAGLVDCDALRQADTLVCLEAARRFAAGQH